MTAVQRTRRDRLLVAAAAAAAGIPYAAIGRAMGLSGQRVKELVETARDLASDPAGAEFFPSADRVRSAGLPRPLRDLRARRA